MGRMANSDINDTVPFSVDTSSDGQPTPTKKKRSPWKSLVLLGILALILIAATSGYAGYAKGITNRKEAEAALSSSKAAEQFDLAIVDIGNEQYQHARQRLEYVAHLNPNYPGLTEKLAEVLARINATATPTIAPTATVAATPDTRGVEAMFSQGEQMVANGDWSGAIDTLLKLRKDDPSYKPVQMDGLLFMALRNRGLDKISKQADLEGGLYDLTLASKFGPLDTEAQGYINWVSLYITGASFWELDWQKVVEYFSQVGPALPGLTDRSGWTAKERYRLGLKNYAQQLSNSGDVCAAAEQFQLSLSVGPDPEVEQLFNDATSACQGAATEESQPEPQPEATVQIPIVTVPPPEATIPPPVETVPPEPTVYPGP